MSEVPLYSQPMRVGVPGTKGGFLVRMTNARAGGDVREATALLPVTV